VTLAPLVETVGHHRAPPLGERGAEGRALGDRLGAGVELPGPFGQVLRPRGHQAPAVQPQLPLQRSVRAGGRPLPCIVVAAGSLVRLAQSQRCL